MLRRGKVRRAKLYYLRGRRGKSARIFERTDARAKRLNAAFKGFKRPKGEADDLTRIKGVTPELAGQLNGLGVIKFDQIANFSDDDIANVDESLVPRRPHREGRLGAPGAGLGGRGRRRRASRGRAQEVGRNSRRRIAPLGSKVNQLAQYG